MVTLTVDDQKDSAALMKFMLEKIDRELYKNVKAVLDNNKSEWHVRGGKATQEKYKGCKKT